MDFSIDFMQSYEMDIEPSWMLYFEQMYSLMSMIWYIPASLIRYASWYSILPRVVLVAVIIFTLCLPTSITRAEVTYLSLKYPSLGVAGGRSLHLIDLSCFRKILMWS